MENLSESRTKTLTCTLLCLPWLVLLGWLTSVSWFLTDDAFISFRYIRNLLEGHGLVFNPGEYVEGYSNFLWVLELAAVWALFGLRPEYAAHILSIAYTVATIAAMLWWIARSPSHHDRGLLAWMSLGLLCSSATFAVWTSGGGLETRQFTFFVLLAIVCLAVHKDSRWGLIVASFSLAAASLTRPEGPLIAACCFAWFAAQRFLSTRRLDWRELAALVAPFAILIAAHFLFRYAYYGEWLPNTYYAKHIRPWYDSGFRYLVAAGLETGMYALLPLAYIALRMRWRIYRDSIYGLVLLCLGAHMAYILNIGGDHFEFRPLDFYWPLLAPPAAEGIALLGSRISTSIQRIQSLPWLLNSQVCALVIFVPVLFYSSSIQAALLFEVAPLRERNLHLQTNLDRRNAGWLLSAPFMPEFVDISNGVRRQLVSQSVALRFAEHREFAREQLEGWRPYEHAVRGVIPDDAVMATSKTGIAPYFVPDLRIIDIHGLTDATVARTPVEHDNPERQMAHDRLPPPGYLEQRGVNFSVYAAAPTEMLALDRASYALRLGPELWMPFDAVDLRWAIENFADRDLRIANLLRVTSLKRNLENDYSISISDGKEAIATPQRQVVQVVSGVVSGTVDKGFVSHVRPGDNLVAVSGWAADIEESQPASQILIIVDGSVIYAGPPTLERQDVARHFGDDALVNSGFALLLPASLLGEGDPAEAEVRVFALSKKDVASELSYGPEFDWSN